MIPFSVYTYTLSICLMEEFLDSEGFLFFFGG